MPQGGTRGQVTWNAYVEMMSNAATEMPQYFGNVAVAGQAQAAPVVPGQPPPAPVGAPGGVSGSKIQKMIAIARTWIGTPFREANPCIRGVQVDCSGLVMNVYTAAGIWSRPAPRIGRDQMKVGTPVAWEGLQAGDRMYFNWGDEGDHENQPWIPDHTAIYIGNGQVIHAGPTRSGGVRVVTLNSYWHRHFIAARRDS
jgi:cell wall-associated NlpC family hydrolase